MEIAVPIAIQRIFDGLKATKALDGLIYGVGLIALFYLGSEIFNSLRIRVNNTLEQRVLLEMRRDLHSKLLRLPVSFYDQRKSGEISSRVIEDVAAVERALLDGTEQSRRYPADLNDQCLSFLSATLLGILRISASSNLANYGYLLLEGISCNLERGARELGRSE